MAPSDCNLARIHSWTDGSLPAAEGDALARHVSNCETCRETLRAIQEVDHMIGRAAQPGSTQRGLPPETVVLEFERVRRRLLREPAPGRSLRGLFLLAAAAAVLVTVSFLIRRTPVSLSPSGQLVASGALVSLEERLRERHPEFFREVHRSVRNEPWLLPVPSEAYPDLESALAVARDGDRLLVPDTSFLGGVVPDGAKEWLFQGRTLAILPLESPDPLEPIRDELAREFASEPLRSGGEGALLKLDLDESCYLQIWSTRDGEWQQAFPVSENRRWYLGNAGSQWIPPAEPAIDFLDAGELTYPSQLARCPELPGGGPSYLENSSQLHCLGDDGRIQTLRVDVLAAPLPLDLEPGGTVLLVRSPQPLEVEVQTLLRDLGQVGATDFLKDVERAMREHDSRVVVEVLEWPGL